MQHLKAQEWDERVVRISTARVQSMCNALPMHSSEDPHAASRNHSRIVGRNRPTTSTDMSAGHMLLVPEQLFSSRISKMCFFAYFFV